VAESLAEIVAPQSDQRDAQPGVAERTLLHVVPPCARYASWPCGVRTELGIVPVVCPRGHGVPWVRGGDEQGRIDHEVSQRPAGGRWLISWWNPCLACSRWRGVSPGVPAPASLLAGFARPPARPVFIPLPNPDRRHAAWALRLGTTMCLFVWLGSGQATGRLKRRSAGIRQDACRCRGALARPLGSI
jgi:hypothetical protein